MDIKIDLSSIKLKTERLILRAFENRDLKDLYEYAKIPGLGEMAGWAHHQSLEDSKKVLEKFKKDKDVLAIEKDGKVIGTIGLHPVDEEFYKEYKDLKGKELGFVLSEFYHRQKIMTEAIKAIMKYAFEDLGLDYLSAGYFRGNFKSRWFQQKLGFNYYGSHIVKLAMGNLEPVHQTIFTKEDYQENKIGHVEKKKKSKPSVELVAKGETEIIRRLYFKKEDEYKSQNKENSYYIVVVEGRVRIKEGGKEYTYFPADALRIKKGQDFTIISRSAAKLVLIEVIGHHE